MPTATAVDPCDFVIFGGTGDLAVRKLLPALYLRDRDGQLTADTRIIAVARAGLDEAGYRDKIHAELGRFVAAELLDTDTVDRFLARLRFVSIDLTEPADYVAVTDVLSAAAVDIRVFYLACAPACSGRSATPSTSRAWSPSVAGGAGEADRPRPRLRAGGQRRRRRGLRRAQIFRIDHYLGKESVQNLLVTRFANTFLEPLWNSSWIDHVQITVAESLGVGDRGDYYDHSGALRDMVQNHLLQLLCLVAMEPPTYVDRETVRDEKLKVLQALKPMTADDVDRDTVAGQYGPGLVDGAVVASYADDVGNPDSTTETFVALRAEVHNWRWAGVPFYLRTGKRMRRGSRRSSWYSKPPHPMFPHSEGATSPTGCTSSCSPTRACGCT